MKIHNQAYTWKLGRNQYCYILHYYLANLPKYTGRHLKLMLKHLSVSINTVSHIAVSGTNSDQHNSVSGKGLLISRGIKYMWLMELSC